MMALLIWAIAAMNVTRAGRRVSAQYINYAGLYDLALAGAEKAFLVIREQAAQNSEYIADYVKDLIRQDLSTYGIENRIIYYNGQFYLTSPFYGFNRFYFSLYQRAMNPVLRFNPIEYHIYVGDTLYTVRICLPSGFSGGSAIVQAEVESNRIERVTFAQAEVRWPNPPPGYAEILIPLNYTWRNEPPTWFEGGVTGLNYIDNNFPLQPTQPWSPDYAVWTGSQSQLNIQNFHVNGVPVPTMIVHNGATPLRLYSSDSPLFEGIIISHAGVILDNITVRGAVVAEITNHSYYDEDGHYLGYYYNYYIQVDTGILFEIPLPEESRRMVFDFLGLTRFGSISEGEREENIAYLLGELQIGTNDEDYEIVISPMELPLPEMTRLLRVVYANRCT